MIRGVGLARVESGDWKGILADHQVFNESLHLKHVYAVWMPFGSSDFKHEVSYILWVWLCINGCG